MIENQLSGVGKLTTCRIPAVFQGLKLSDWNKVVCLLFFPQNEFSLRNLSPQFLLQRDRCKILSIILSHIPKDERIPPPLTYVEMSALQED